MGCEWKVGVGVSGLGAWMQVECVCARGCRFTTFVWGEGYTYHLWDGVHRIICIVQRPALRRVGHGGHSPQSPVLVPATVCGGEGRCGLGSFIMVFCQKAIYENSNGEGAGCSGAAWLGLLTAAGGGGRRRLRARVCAVSANNTLGASSLRLSRHAASVGPPFF